MTVWSVIYDILMSMLTAFFFWLATFVISGNRLIMSDVIEKSLVEKQEDEEAIYRLRIMNIGIRDMMEVSYSAKFIIREETTSRTTYLYMGDVDTVPILKGWDGKKKNKFTAYIPGFYIRDTALREFSKSHYPEAIREAAKRGKLTLHQLLAEYGDRASITVYVSGNDRLTGARKTFVSKEYTKNDFIEGKYKTWGGPRRRTLSFLQSKKEMTKLISAIHTVDSVFRETCIDPIEILNNTEPEAKPEFLEREDLRKPNNAYGRLKIEEVEEKIKQLQTFLGYMGQGGALSPKAAAEKALLEHEMLGLRFIQANYRYLHSTQREKARWAREHSELNAELYGLPEESVYRSLLQDRQRKLGGAKLYRPEDELFRTFAAKINERMEPLMDHIPEGKEIFTVQEACDIANEILREVWHADEMGWKAVVEPNYPSASVDQTERRVKFPGKRTRGDYSREDLRAILAHELGVHVCRALPGNKAGSFALSVGLPHYESFEEGLAVAAEQAVRGRFTHPGCRHYLSIGLACFERLDFRGVFERQLELFGRDELDRSLAFDSVQRAFRGTGELLNSKDLVYFRGCELVWRYIGEHVGDADFLDSLFALGKIDPTRREHLDMALRILGRTASGD